MVYQFLLTICKIIVGLATEDRLIYAAVICFGVYLIWIALALAFSFQRKFYAKSTKMYNFLKNHDNLTDCTNFVNEKSAKMSVGFAHGWKKFAGSQSGKPSMFISRHEALDSEVSGGLFNQGKSIMKSFIWISTVLLLVVNAAFHGADKTITFTLLAESALLPVFYFILMKIFYYLYTVVRQQLYKLDIETFYELIDLMDEKFEKNPNENVLTLKQIQTKLYQLI